ncbi:MAG: hypothetical protein COB35_00215 [Gammaproteobacteria bacterium]|nr:MAG: hypothetical protein COB35_00215 [Gammaproteobacteria bacterium]
MIAQHGYADNLGIYLHNFSDYIDSFSVTGIIISATFIAFNLDFLLPTKMYLTFLLIKRVTEHQNNHQNS